MKIAVLSDTHIKETNLNLLKEFLKTLPKVNMIIHAGDLSCYESLELLEEVSDTIAVFGNVDNEKSRDVLKKKEIIEIDNYKIGVFHGDGDKGDTLRRVKDIFKDDILDIIIYGHSHKPTIFTDNGTIYINPGSPFYKRKEKYFTYVLLDLDREKILTSLIFHNHII